MATLSPELVTQRSGKALVGVSYDSSDNSPSETYWGTSTAGTAVTVDKSVAGNQADRAVVEQRLYDAKILQDAPETPGGGEGGEGGGEGGGQE